MRPVLHSGRGGATDAVRPAGRGAPPPAGKIRRMAPAAAKTWQSRAGGMTFTDVAGYQKPLVSSGSATEFDDICFAYAGGRVVFDGLSLSIRPGEKVGLVGASRRQGDVGQSAATPEDIQRRQIR